MTETKKRLPRYAVGSICSNRRYGCVGRIVVKVVRYRNAAGELSNVRALICSKCGQAYGPA